MINMKKIIAIVVLINGYGISELRAQTVASFNFSMTPRPVTGWTNVVGDPNTGIRTATSNGISISSVATTNWSVVDGLYKGDGLGVQNGTYFPADVMNSFWAQYNRSTSLYNAGSPQLQISGLNKDSVYYLRMTASFQYSAWDCDPVQYTVAGSTIAPSQYLNAFNNTSMGVTFQHVAPDANGVIRVYVNATGESDMANISGIQIISGSATIGIPAVAITSPANNNILPEESNITISATASETGSSITKVEFYAGEVKIGEADAAPYTMVWMNPDEGHYLITAKATDVSGTTNIATINISVESLTSFWSMTGNINMNADSNFVGNVDSVRLAFRTKNIERMSISPMGTVRMNQYKNDNLGTSFLTTDTSGNLKLKALKFMGGLKKVGDSVQLGGNIYTPVEMDYYRAVNYMGQIDTVISGTLSYGDGYYSNYDMLWDTVTNDSKIDQITIDPRVNDITIESFQKVYRGGADWAGIYQQASRLPGETGMSLTVTDALGTNNGIEIYSTGIDFVSPGIQFRNFLNNATGDSVLITDAGGNMHLKDLSSFNSLGHWQTTGSTSYDSLDNIGIGTSNTQGYKLAVNGNAIFSKIRVKAQSGWPDYVFKKDYRLPPLKDVEHYIKAHQHLPGVQSAEDVAKEDQDLGATQAVFLKKMEEMTLYIIELNKKVEKLSQENEKLKKRMPIPQGHKTK